MKFRLGKECAEISGKAASVLPLHEKMAVINMTAEFELPKI